MEVLLRSLLPLNTTSDEQHLQDCYHVLLGVPHSIMEDLITGNIVQSSSVPAIKRRSSLLKRVEWTNRTTNSSSCFFYKFCSFFFS